MKLIILLFFLSTTAVMSCNLYNCNGYCINYVRTYNVQLIFNTHLYLIKSNEVYGICRLTDENKINCSCFIDDKTLPVNLRQGYDSILY